MAYWGCSLTANPTKVSDAVIKKKFPAGYPSLISRMYIQYVQAAHIYVQNGKQSMCACGRAINEIFIMQKQQNPLSMPAQGTMRGTFTATSLNK